MACGAPVVVTGGQFCAHDPVQVDVIPVSARKKYSVLPLAPTRI
jgi:hypothetical protein